MRFTICRGIPKNSILSSRYDPLSQHCGTERRAGWNSSGGVLEIKAGIAAQPNKNSYTAWDEAGRIQNDFINYLLSVNCHTICTLRVKQDYVLTENDRGKQVPVKVGMAPVQRDDVEYEFDLMLNIGRDHIATASKDVTFLDGLNTVITPELGKQLADWANEGKEPVLYHLVWGFLRCSDRNGKNERF